VQLEQPSQEHRFRQGFVLLAQNALQKEDCGGGDGDEEGAGDVAGEGGSSGVAEHSEHAPQPFQEHRSVHGCHFR